jgi:ubiquinone/menaquinone biosynthesis C-methylase UbiE
METDYSKIASRYDDNKVRLKDVDPYIEELLKTGRQEFKILDLACGTGKYLKIQIDFYKDAPIKWLGADRSKEMLAVSQSKGINADFICCDADDPSISPESTLDYIRNEYAWHHFTDHPGTIRNIYRMLKPGGLFTMVNICPEYMKSYWVHHYFPGTRSIDEDRFISCEDIMKSFRILDFDVKIKIKTIVSELKLEMILDEAVNRDISQLTLIGDDEYKAGIQKIKEDLERGTQNIHDMAFIEMNAQKLLI